MTAGTEIIKLMNRTTLYSPSIASETQIPMLFNICINRSS